MKAVLYAAIALPLIFLRVRANQAATDTGVPACPDPVGREAPTPKNMVRPKYPSDALRRDIGGKVEIRAIVAADGRTKDVLVLTGDPAFARNAVAAVRKWHFVPITAKGQPVETSYKIHVRFNPLLREANSDLEIESPPAVESPPPPLSAWPKENIQDHIYRVSEPGVVPPKALYSPEPEFTERARKAKEQSKVGIALIVGVDGLPRNVRVACGSAPDLNENAIESVKQWKFAPGTKDGKPVPVALLVEVSFKLN